MSFQISGSITFIIVWSTERFVSYNVPCSKNCTGQITRFVLYWCSCYKELQLLN